MRKSTKIILPLAAFAILAGAALYGPTGASAMGAGRHGGGFADLSQKIAERFNLNKDDVDNFFAEERENHQAQMRTQLEERFSQAVKDGKLTEDQKTALLKIMDAHQADRAVTDNMTPEERKAKMKANRAEIEKWASDNGVNLADLKFIGFGKKMGRGHDDSDN